MFHQFTLIQDKTHPTRFHVEIDGMPVDIRTADIHVGVDEVPTVKLELLATSVVEMDAEVDNA